MASVWISDDDSVINLAAPAGGVTVDVPVLIGELFGIPTTTAAEGVTFALKVRGQCLLPKTSALAISVGDGLYWDDGNTEVDKTATSQPPVAVATKAAANPSSQVEAVLTGPGGRFLEA